MRESEIALFCVRWYLRDEQRVRQRYLRMRKETLVERLITAERRQAELRERWLTQQDEALTWRLRAEVGEARLKESGKM